MDEVPTLTVEQNLNLYRLMVGTGTLSFVFSLGVVLSHAFLTKSRRRLNDPVFWLSFSCMFCPFFTLRFGDWGPIWCLMEGVGNQFFNLASFFWVTCIGHQLYQVICKDHPIDSGYFLPMYHLFSWGLPGLSVLILLAAGQVDEIPADIGWCWVAPGVWSLFTFYMPMFILVLLNCVTYVVIIRTVYERYSSAMAVQSGRRSSVAFARQTMYWGLKASLYLLVFIVTRTGSSAHRIHEFLAPNSPSFALNAFHVAASGLQGFVYALVYINNERVISRLQDACRPSYAVARNESDLSFPYAESSLYSEGSRIEDEEDLFNGDEDDEEETTNYYRT